MTRLESGRLRLLIARATARENLISIRASSPISCTRKRSRGRKRRVSTRELPRFPYAIGKSVGTRPGDQLGIRTSLLAKVMRVLGAGVAEIGGTFVSVMGGAPSPRGTVWTTWLGGSAVAEPMPGREETGPRMNAEIDDLAETRLCNCG